MLWIDDFLLSHFPRPFRGVGLKKKDDVNVLQYSICDLVLWVRLFYLCVKPMSLDVR